MSEALTADAREAVRLVGTVAAEHVAAMLGPLMQPILESLAANAEGLRGIGEALKAANALRELDRARLQSQIDDLRLKLEYLEFERAAERRERGF